MPYGSTEEFLSAVTGLIDGWCDKRSFRPLSRLLGPYLGFNGMTDGWADLAGGLKNVRVQDRAELIPGELEIIDDLIRAADKMTSGSKASSVGRPFHYNPFSIILCPFLTLGVLVQS
jgi:hypothetical protein